MYKRKVFKAIVRRIPHFMSENQFYEGFTKKIHVEILSFKFVTPSKGISMGHHYEESICYYYFARQEYLNEFISKFGNFQIKDDKGLVYHLHISRAIHQGCPDPDMK